MLHECPICLGDGRLMVVSKSGQLQESKTVYCNCWACRGRGKISFPAQEKRDPSTETMIPGGQDKDSC